MLPVSLPDIKSGRIDDVILRASAWQRSGLLQYQQSIEQSGDDRAIPASPAGMGDVVSAVLRVNRDMRGAEGSNRRRGRRRPAAGLRLFRGRARPAIGG